MTVAIGSRELFTLDGQGVLLKGTYHRPRNLMSPAPDLGHSGRMGVLFINSLFLPRTATGDSAVYWAESFAARGYHAFRMDLPGLGDSDAPLNTTLLDFINAGGYGAIASAKVRELVARFDLEGLVIVGHCAGGVTALFAAAASEACKGVVLLDPYFYLPQQLKKSKAWKRLVRWAASSVVGGALSAVYDRLKDLRLSLRGKRPPGNANFPLLRRWSEVAGKGLPVLLFKAPGRKSPGSKARVGEFDYIEHLLALSDGKNQVEIQVIENTDHSFANRAGRSAIRDHVQRWLDIYFSLPQFIESPEDPTKVVAAVNEMDYGNHVECL